MNVKRIPENEPRQVYSTPTWDFAIDDVWWEDSPRCRLNPSRFPCVFLVCPGLPVSHAKSCCPPFPIPMLVFFYLPNISKILETMEPNRTPQEFPLRGGVAKATGGCVRTALRVTLKCVLCASGLTSQVGIRRLLWQGKRTGLGAPSGGGLMML